MYFARFGVEIFRFLYLRKFRVFGGGEGFGFKFAILAGCVFFYL